MGWGVRMPATTSSPCALTRNSPKNFRDPVDGSRVNATPVAQSSPMLPKTMDCTVTAVPQSSGMALSLRYVMARGLIQLPNTAPTAPQSCSQGSSGNIFPLVRTICLNCWTRPLRSSAVSWVSSSTPRACLRSSSALSNWLAWIPSTTSEYMQMKRR
jgi:hypothetical protein